MSTYERDFIQAYHDNADALFRYCLFKVSDRERAIDLVQECFTKTWSYVAEGKTVDSFKPFLYRTLNNLIIDEYRRKKDTSLDALVDQGFDVGMDPREALLDSLDGKRAVALLQKLPEEYREVIYLRFVDGLSFAEIADATGENTNTLTVRAHRGIKKLKELITYGY